MYTFSELILNIRKVGKIDSRKMQGQSAFRAYCPNMYTLGSLLSVSLPIITTLTLTYLALVLSTFYKPPS